MIEYTVKVDEDGSRYWYLNDKLHREDGPAIEYANGDRSWCLNGLLHREDGPAVEWSDGDFHWYLNGERYSEEEFLKKTNKHKEEPLVYNRKLHDAVDILVVASLQDYYDTCSEPSESDWTFDIDKPDAKLLNSIKVVLSHYMAGVDYDEWLRSVERKNNGI